MANRNIQTHTPDGNELDNKPLAEGTIAVRGNQLIIGDGTTEASELDPVAGPLYGTGGTTSFVIASGTVDLNVAGTTELTYGTGFTGINHVPQVLIIAPENETDTYTNAVGQTESQITINSNNICPELAFNGALNFNDYIGYGLDLSNGDTVSENFSWDNIAPLGFYYKGVVAADKYNFVVGATPPSSTQFRVTVKILGIKTT